MNIGLSPSIPSAPLLECSQSDPAPSPDLVALVATAATVQAA